MQLPILSNDITAACFSGELGHLSLFNIYNDCTHNESTTSLASFLSSNLSLVLPAPTDSMVWLRDINRHHPLWESETNRQLNSPPNLVRPLLDLIEAYDMDLALPSGVPMYETCTHKWTRPNNVWVSHHAFDLITSCTTTPHIRPPNADHLLIVMTVDLMISRTDKPPTRDFRGIDFNDFNKALKTNLALLSPRSHILTKADFDSAVLSLTSTIQQTIGDLIPLQKPCPFTKCWWSSNLTALKKKKNCLSNTAHKVRHIRDHPAHVLHKQAIKEFAKTIDKAATDHWTDWLENISPSQIYLANRYITEDPSDASSTHIPALRTPPCSPVIIGSDSQATIQALMNQRSHLAHHLLNHIHTLAEHLHATHYKLRHPSTPLSAKQLHADYQHDIFDLQIHWNPGHVDFPPNKRADAVAKSTAAGMSSPSCLLLHSIPALHHTNLTQLRHEWKRRWKRSPRFRYTSPIDSSLPSNSYLKLINGLDHGQSAILTQLCTAHSPLNQHLFRIRHSVTPVCPHCGGLIPKRVTHYLLQCPHYQYERHILRHKLKCKADSLPFLLLDSITTLPLLKFIRTSKCSPTPPPTS